MIWLTWRQQRLETLMAAALLALVAALLVVTGHHMASVYQRDGLAACAAHAGCSTDSVQAFESRFAQLGGIVGWLKLLPALLGILLAAPLALELEHGTHRLAWTQGITRRRWLGVRLTLILAGGLVASLLLVALFTWWRAPLDHLQGRLDSDAFGFEGAAPIAYTLFALTATLALGSVLRRALPAIALGLIGFVGARLAIEQLLRPHYQHPLTATWSTTSPAPRSQQTAWVLDSGLQDHLGHTLPNGSALRLCGNAHSGADSIGGCLAHHGIHQFATYQPNGRFWTFQAIETTIFLAAALILLGLAAWIIQRRVT